ncbi:MAG TPA: universal stress protein [Gemmatimonadales bacterium]|nr:universal stress protein [Gemmatimonadales bacterium]
MITHPIVVGVDGSSESGSAAAIGWMLARAAGVRCQLVHATHDASASFELAGSGAVTESLQLALLAQARAEVGSTLGETVPAAVVDGMVVSTGGAQHVLDAVIAEMDASILVLGGKHHSRLGRWLGGSTVQNMVRRVNVPLLVTAGELRARPRVLVAVDQSYAAAPTVRQAVAFAQLLGSPLRALHVIDPAPAIAELPRDWSREIVERDIWPIIPLVDEAKVMREGVPFDTIVSEATAWKADVIVVGSHGKGWVDRLLIGSVTEDLLNNLPCAVLVVPVRQHAEAAVEVETVTAPATG